MIEITLPWPDKALNPNSRNRWAKIKATKQARHDAYWLTLQTCPLVFNLKDRSFEACLTYYPPDWRKRDILDNLPSSMKPYIDGVCDLLNIDDSQIRRTINEWGEVVKGGKVVLRLEEMK